MKIKVIGTSSLAQACRRAAEERPEWVLTQEDYPDRIIYCGEQAPAESQLRQWADKTGGILCATTVAWPEEMGKQARLQIETGSLKAMRPECFRPYVAGVRSALGSQWIGAVGAVNLTRKRLGPFSGGRDALSQCGMEEVSVILSLLGTPQRLFCTAADLKEAGQQVSLTLQMGNGAVANIQAVQGGKGKPYFQYEYAGQYGLADYDSRQGALRLDGEGALLEDWPWESCAQAVEEALSSPNDNGMGDLLRIQMGARRSLKRRQVVEWKGAEL